MKLVRWLPSRGNGSSLMTTPGDVNRLFEDFFSPAPFQASWPSLAPAVDVEETPDGYVFRADLPGMQPKDVKITMNGDTLTLRGERKREEKKTDDSFHRIERSYGTFERSYTLGAPVRADQVKASYKDGVLEIRVPKAEEAKAREIDVQVG